jgi:hypothetical protein
MLRALPSTRPPRAESHHFMVPPPAERRRRAEKAAGVSLVRQAARRPACEPVRFCPPGPAGAVGRGFCRLEQCSGPVDARLRASAFAFINRRRRTCLPRPDGDVLDGTRSMLPDVARRRSRGKMSHGEGHLLERRAFHNPAFFEQKPFVGSSSCARYPLYSKAPACRLWR